jgi:4-amino-4-deoxy-L-arabinose transferase-like glycosyltransferase
MALTFSATLALCSFYSAIHAEKEKLENSIASLCMEASPRALNGASRSIIPAWCFSSLLTHQWSILRRLTFPGALLCFVIVIPWYLWADARNPGYLRYYFWDDHVTRYLTDEFGRTKSWFYFLFVVAVGFLPWTLCLPFVAKDCWQKLDDKKMFLVLWVVLPFLFFLAKFKIATLCC